LVFRGGVIVGFRATRPKGARAIDGEPGVLLPGLVSAHTHLRFSQLSGRRATGGGFAGWIRRVLAAPPPQQAEVVARARALAASGTTCVGDHDPDGLGAFAMRKVGIRGVAFRELFSFDPGAGRAAVRAAAAAARAAVRPPVLPGLAPHATYTATREALAAAARARMRVSIHLAETADEIAWLRGGEGPLERLLWDRGRRPLFPVPQLSPAELLARAGLLRPGTLLIHANEVGARDLGRFARAGCAAVHCPGTHAYFRRGDPPVRRWLAAGLPFALGTDSLASNRTLDLFGEMARLHASDPAIPPNAIVEAATLGGARALGLPRVGALLPRYAADIVCVRADVTTSRPDRFFRLDLLEALLHRPRVIEVRLASA
jgi:cytosine/adenosine deaminase-related metal-dependent hydrolase